MSSRSVFIIAGIIVLALGWWFVFGPGAEVDTQTSPKAAPETISLNLGGGSYSVEVARSANELKKGLGGRESLDEDTGLLLFFEEDGEQGIWMKNMRFPIDVLWLSSDFEVLYIEENIVPESFPKIFLSPVNARHVLEVGAGVVSREGVNIGDRLR